MSFFRKYDPETVQHYKHIGGNIDEDHVTLKEHMDENYTAPPRPTSSYSIPTIAEVIKPHSATMTYTEALSVAIRPTSKMLPYQVGLLVVIFLLFAFALGSDVATSVFASLALGVPALMFAVKLGYLKA
jgi:hypothetical protein